MNEENEETNGRRSRRTYSGAFKAQVVMEALEGGRGLDEIARQYNLHPNQIKNWKCILRKRMGIVFEDRRRARMDSDEDVNHRHSGQREIPKADAVQPPFAGGGGLLSENG